MEAVEVVEMKEPPVELVFGFDRRLPENSNDVRLFAPAASIQAVSFKIAQLPKLSAILTRDVAELSLIAVVAAVVPRLVIRLLVKVNPSQEFAVALPVKIVKAFKIELVSLNAQLSIWKSVGVEVPVAVNTDAISAKFITNSRFCRMMLAAVTGMFAVVAVVKVKVGRIEPTP